MDISLNDERFEQGAGWVQFHQDEQCRQRYLIEGGAFFAETLMSLRGSRDAMVAMLQDCWTWWKYGSSSNFRRGSDHSCDMDFKPVRWHIARFHIHLFPPSALSGQSGVRLPALFTGHFEGPASYDICSQPGKEGSVMLRSRCHGVRNHVPLAPTSMVVSVHLRAEAGNLGFPFPKGTGFIGLSRP
jgi:hypothetical protein